jgi:hypothetical protein
VSISPNFVRQAKNRRRTELGKTLLFSFTNILSLRAGVSNSNVFKGHILIKNGLAGRIRPKNVLKGRIFLKYSKNLVIFGHFLILIFVAGRTEHVDGPHAACEMPVWDPWLRDCAKFSQIIAESCQSLFANFCAKKIFSSFELKEVVRVCWWNWPQES